MIKNTTNPSKEEIAEMAELADELRSSWPSVFKFINYHKHKPAECIIYTLKALRDKKDKWAYGTTVINKITGDYYNKRFIKEHEARKTIPSAGDILKAIMEG